MSALLNGLGIGFLKQSLVNGDPNALISILLCFPNKNEMKDFLDKLGQDFLEQIILDDEALFEIAENYGGKEIIHKLSIEFFKKRIKCPLTLAAVLWHFTDETARAAFKNKLNIQFFQCDQLNDAQYQEIRKLVEKLENHYVSSESKNESKWKLNFCFEQISQNARESVLEKLSKDVCRRLLQDNTNLVWTSAAVCKYLSSPMRIDFLNNISYSFFEKMNIDIEKMNIDSEYRFNNCKNRLINILGVTSEEWELCKERFYLLLAKQICEALKEESWSYERNIEPLFRYLKSLNPSESKTFWIMLENHPLREKIFRKWIISETSRERSSDDKVSFLKSLDKDILQSITKTEEDIQSIESELYIINAKAKFRCLIKINDNQIKKAIMEASKDYLYENNRIGYDKYQTTANSAWSGVKLFGTFGVYAAYRCHKYDSRMEAIKGIESPTIEDLLKVLNDGKGGNELGTLNHSLVSHLLELTAGSDEEAESMVDVTKTELGKMANSQANVIESHFSILRSS